jgi:hypothetical protein
VTHLNGAHRCLLPGGLLLYPPSVPHSPSFEAKPGSVAPTFSKEEQVRFYFMILQGMP